MNIKKIIFRIFLFIIIPSILIEVFIFNLRYFESLNYKNSKELSSDIKNLEISKNQTIKINNINQDMNNLYLDINSNIDNFKYAIYAKDKGNEEFYKLPSRTYSINIEQSKYIKLNLNKNVKSLKFKFYAKNNRSYLINIKSIKTNVTKPFFISLERIAFLIIVFSLFYIFRFKSKLYKIRLLDRKYKNFNIVCISLFLISQLFLIYSLTNMNPFFKNPIGAENQRQYNNLAVSFSKGKTYIDKKISPTLIELSNPYDYFHREKKLEKNNETYLWDYAFYNNKYYVYFGVVPEIIAYLPYYLLFNKQLSNATYLFIVLSGTFILIFLNLLNIIKKYFKETKTLHFILLLLLSFNSSFLLYVAKRPDFYSVPIVTGLFFTLLGIYLWSTSINENKLNKIKLFFGSLSMALVAGCRPQLLLGSFLCFIIFKDFIKKKNIKEIIIFMIPYLLVAIPLMYYNYIRFNSPFDFGANYNLTFNDMTVRGFKFDRTFLGIFYTLFYRNPITLLFPFIEYSSIKTQYLGTTIFEESFGGIITNNIILLLGLFSYKFKKIINNNKLYIFSLLCILFMFIIIVVDIQMAGILVRYILDYSWLLIIPTIIVVLSLLNNIKDNNIKNIVNKFIIVLIFLSLIYNFMLIPVDYSYSIKNRNSKLYYKIANLVEFWL